MLEFSSWLFVLSGMLLLDSVLCVMFLRKISEGLLELIITALVFVIGKLTEENPVTELGQGIFSYIAIAAVTVALGVMLYHLFWKIIPASPYRRNKKQHHHQKPQPKNRDN